MKDNLESFFKKYLLKEDQLIEEWVEPSVDVWLNASKILDEKSKDKKIFWLWNLVGLLSLGLVVLVIYINNIESKNKSIIDSQKNKSITKISPPLNKNATRSLITYKTEQSISNPVETIKVLNSGKTPNSKTSMKETKTQVRGIENNLKTPTVNNFHKSYLTLSSKKYNFRSYTEKNERSKRIIYPDVNNPTIIEQLPLLKMHKYKLVVNEVLPDPIKDLLSIINVVPKSKAPNPHKHEISFFYGPSLTSTPMKASKEMALNGYKKLQVSANLGLKYKYFFNNEYYMNLGMEYLTVKSWSFSRNEYYYDSNGEYIDLNGNLINIITVPLPSPIGEMSTQITIRQSSNNTIKEGDLFIADMESHQKYQFVNIPIGLGIQKIIHNKHNFKLGVDLNISYMLNQENEFEASFSYNDNKSKMNLVKSDIINLQELNKKLFSISGELGYYYKLKDNIFIGLSTSYFRSLNNLYSQENIKTKMHGIKFNVGFSIKI